MYSAIYWLTRVDVFIGAMIFIMCICVISIVILLVNREYSDDIALDDKRIKKASITFIMTGLFVIFTPSKNDLILIYAGGKAYEYIQSDTSLQKIPYKTTEYLKLVLEKEIKKVNE